MPGIVGFLTHSNAYSVGQHMAQVAKKGSQLLISFTEGEAKELGMKAGQWHEISRAREGIWVLTASAENIGVAPAAKDLAVQEKKPVQGIDEIEQKIAGLLRKTPARDRMEGWFEKKLGREEIGKFREMLADGRVIKFKSSEVFRKALYTLPKKQAGRIEAAKAFENVERPFQEFTLEKDGFLVVKNEERAKALSEELRDRIKAGEIKGTRSFTGEFFIIYTALLESAEKKVLDDIKKAKTCTLGELGERLKLTPTLIRIALEFLKEEGQVIEKRKDIYKYIE